MKSLFSESNAIVGSDEVDIGVAKLLKLLADDLKRVLLTSLRDLEVLKVAAIGTDAFEIAQNCLD